MAVDLTNRLALIKPRGGSSGSTPAEPVDVDQFNQNADTIDAQMGAPACISSARPAGTFEGQLAYETDTKNLIRYSTSSSTWVSVVGGVDTGWQSLTLASGISGTMFYRIQRNVVYLAGTTLPTSNNQTQFTLPVGARSQYARSFPLYRGTGAGDVVTCRILANGQAQYYGPGGSGSIDWGGAPAFPVS